MKKGLLVIALALLMVLIAPGGCKAPAEFEVTSLDVMPLEVIAGEAVNVTAEVENTGASEGTYTAVLTVDGVEVERKDIVITAGAAGTVTFSLVKDTPGSYQIGIGGLTSTLIVERIAEQVELKYDDGKPDGRWAIGGPGRGHLVQFSPPSEPFTINRVTIFGSLYGTGYENRTFTIQVWDRDLNEIYSASHPHTKFSLSQGWVEVEIPAVAVDGNFYIHVCTQTPREGGIQICYDSSLKNEHSEVTANWEIADWYLETPKEKVNWMIRVVGVMSQNS